MIDSIAGPDRSRIEMATTIRPPRRPEARRGRPRGWLAVACLLAGCSDPHVGLLPAGAKVVVRRDLGDSARVWIAAGAAGHGEEIDLPAGTPAVVVGDREAEPPIQPELRFVRIRIEGGENRGLEGEVSRYRIEPAP